MAASDIGFPAITTPNSFDLRSMQTAVGNTRQRIEKLEAFIKALQLQANATGGSTALDSQIASLRAALNALTRRVTAIENWFAGADEGIVVWNGSSLITRLLGAGTGISISNADGVAGNPTITATGGGGGGGGDVVLYDDFGRAGLAADGGAIFMASGA